MKHTIAENIAFTKNIYNAKKKFKKCESAKTNQEGLEKLPQKYQGLRINHQERGYSQSKQRRRNHAASSQHRYSTAASNKTQSDK
jgi:hypothetical protein